MFANFTAEQKTLAESIFSKLIEVGQGRVDTRRTATFAELVPEGTSEATVAEIVYQLAHADARLITTHSGLNGEELTPDTT